MRITNTENLGYRELDMVREVLNAWLDDGLPDDFYDDFEDLILDFDYYRNGAYITNTVGQIAMLNGDKLESYYTTPNQGVKGFLEDLIKSVESGEIDDYEDIKYVLEICDNAYDDDGIIACKKSLLYEDLKTDIEGDEMTIEELDDKLAAMDLSLIQESISNDCQRRVYEYDEYDAISFEVYIQEVYESDDEDDDDKVYEVVTIEVA